MPGSNRPTMSPGERLVDRRRAPRAMNSVELARGARACRCARASRSMPRSKRPEQTRRNAIAVAVVGSMFAWILKTKPREARRRRVDRARRSVARGAGGGASSRKRVEERLDAEVGQRAAEEHRRQLAGANALASRTRRRRRRAARARRAAARVRVGAPIAPASAGSSMRSTCIDAPCAPCAAARRRSTCRARRS